MLPFWQQSIANPLVLGNDPTHCCPIGSSQAAPGGACNTTGRLTSEMVIKTVHMEIPILVSRSGFTAWGVELARRAGLTLIGRAKGQRFVVLAGGERLRYDRDLDSTANGEHDEPADGQGSRRNRGIARKR